MADFIPSAADAFDRFTKSLGPVVVDAANPLKVAPEIITAWTSADAAWNTAWQAWQDLAPAVRSALATKDGARAALVTVAREVNNTAQANTSLTDADRADAGLPVHKTSRTPVHAPQTAPVIVKLDNEHLLQRVHFAHSAHQGSRARPVGAALCEIRQQLVSAGGAAPADPETMPLLALDSRPPHRTDFDAEDMGKTAFYALRWVSGRGEQGPWSAISGFSVF